MPTGQVKWFDPKKGYGFIIGTEGQDVFVHYSAILGDGFRYLKDGETVDYELVQGDKGDQAKNVVRSDPPRGPGWPGCPGRAGHPGRRTTFGLTRPAVAVTFAATDWWASR